MAYSGPQHSTSGVLRMHQIEVMQAKGYYGLLVDLVDNDLR